MTSGSSRGNPGEPLSSDPPDRPEWDPARCRPDPGGRWTIRWAASTASTNTDAVSLAAAGGPDRSVVIADRQTAGRGRLGRGWQAPRGAALTFSVLLRPRAVPAARRGWIGALLGLAVTAAVAGRTGLSAGLKWPNDVLIGGRKVAGILAELAPAALVVGAGINVSLVEAELPRPDAGSLLLAGADPGDCRREDLLAAVLDELGPRLERWEAAGGDAERSGVRADYRAQCETLGRAVRIELPAAAPVTGTAVDVAEDGSIVIDDGITRHRFAAGDVQHLRTR